MDALPTTRQLVDSAPEVLDHRIRVEMYDTALWEKFYQVCNEMIVTRQGRKMFPVMKLNISGLEPAGMYAVILQFNQIGNQRLKYMNGEWSSGGRVENTAQKNFFYHGDSPNYGFHWMRNQVAFSKLKLSNKEASAHQVRLNSLHKYEPVLKIFKIEAHSMHLVHKQAMHVCQFIAVTAYQNEKVTNLKIQYNPFAKSFLEAKERNLRNEFVESSFENQKENAQQNYYMLLNHEGNQGYSQQHLQHGRSSGVGMSCYGMNGLYSNRAHPYSSPNPNIQLALQAPACHTPNPMGNTQQHFNSDPMSGGGSNQQENHYHQNYYSALQVQQLQQLQQQNSQKLQQQNSQKHPNSQHQDIGLSYPKIRDYRYSMINNQLSFPHYNNYISQQYQHNGNLAPSYPHFTTPVPVQFANQPYHGLYQMNHGSTPLKSKHDKLDSSGGSPDNLLNISLSSADDADCKNDSPGWNKNDSDEWNTECFNYSSNRQEILSRTGAVNEHDSSMTNFDSGLSYFNKVSDCGYPYIPL